MHTDIHAWSRIRTHNPMFEGEKTIYALDGAASVIGISSDCLSMALQSLRWTLAAFSVS
jgi:hypothetical protein